MITRHFIDAVKDGNTRRIHYRRAGSGPPLLLVHQSPRSSKEYEALMKKWSAHFTCIAPDTPGFGQSVPLPGNPEINEYADAIIEFLDAIGIEKCAAYGFHSGGIILVTAVKRHPNRITTLAVGGYAIWSKEEAALFGEKYLPEFHPSSYGEHLTWLWNRILEQSWFFPWFETDDHHRLSFAHDDPTRVDAVIRDMLDAGNAYQAGYGAVLRAPRDIPEINAEMPPCLISAYDGDPLQEHIDRLGKMPPTWSALKVATPEEHLMVSLTHLREMQQVACCPLNQAHDEGFIEIETEQFTGLIHWRGNQGACALVLHAPGSAIDEAISSDSIAIDLPGHGMSDDWTGEPPVTWDEWQAVINQVATKLETKSLLFANPPKGDPELLYPDLSPDRFGNYLTKAWQIVRAMEIYEPWYKADNLHNRAFDQTVLLPEKLAEKHLELLNARAAKQYHLALNTRQRTNDGN